MMDDPDIASVQLDEELRKFSTFTGLREPDQNDSFVLVLGITGSGKSTFVSRCTGEEVVVGHDLYSCTDSVSIFDYVDNGKHIYLIDTPGFDDTTRSATEILNTMASYLSASYANGVRIHGIILLHRITDNRMGGAGVRNIEILHALCGLSSYSNMVIASTMWPSSPSSRELSALLNRETQLKNERKFFGEFVRRGAFVMRHVESGNRSMAEEMMSARRIVSHVIQSSERSPQVPLGVQRELVDEGKSLEQTGAGVILWNELRQATEKHQRELQELKDEMVNKLRIQNREYTSHLKSAEQQLKAQLKSVQAQKRDLEQTMEEMHAKERNLIEERIREMDKRFREVLAAKEEELQDLEESNRLMREDIRLRSGYGEKVYKPGSDSPPNYEDVVEQEFKDLDEIVDASRKEVKDYRTAYERFLGKKGNIRNGLANGLAAGGISGSIAAASSATASS